MADLWRVPARTCALSAVVLAMAWLVVLRVGLDDITPSLRGRAEVPPSDTDALVKSVNSPRVLSAERATQIKTTAVTDLPDLDSMKPFSVKWDGSDGVMVRRLQTPGPLSNRPVLAVTAAATDGRHRIGLQINNLEAHRLYKIAAWVKVSPGVHVMLDVRDGALANQTMTKFDPAAHAVLSSQGKQVAQGVQLASNEWTKMWLELPSSDGQIFVYVGVLGESEAELFVGTGQQMTFGGVEIAPN